MEEIFYWIKMTMSGHYYYLVALVAIVPLFIFMKKRRINFLVPMMLITALVLSPFFYKIFIDYAGYVYWRMLWLLPVVPICAVLPCVISEKIKEKYLGGKIAVIGVFIVTFILLGTFIYTNYWGEFDLQSNNTFKLPNAVAEVSDYLLTLDDNPRVVVTPEDEWDDYIGAYLPCGLNHYIRQYTGKIDMLYGRIGYIVDPSSEAVNVHNILASAEGDMSIVAKTMLNGGYKYLVIKDEDEITQKKLYENGFVFKNRVGEYSVYEIYGNPTIRKEKNERGQITSETYIDEYGDSVNGEKGYSTIEYEYDQNGNIVREFRTDKNGKGVLDEKGYAGFERKYDFKSRIISEKMLDENGQPTEGFKDYVEIRKKYGYKKVTEGYYDGKGNLIRIINGYAKVCRYYNKDNKVIREQYFDENENPCLQVAGYCGIGMDYDDSGKVTAIRYLNSEGDEVNRTEGYSKVCWELNEEKGSRDIVFFDVDGNKVPIEGINLSRNICYYSDGWTNWMTPEPGKENVCFSVGSVNLGPKEEGDIYTCSITIEFRDVDNSQNDNFKFISQGATDGKWEIGNIWNHELIYLTSVPQNGVYSFESDCLIDETMTHASEFNIGFRCDNWSAGSFRVRDVKIQKGEND